MQEIYFIAAYDECFGWNVVLLEQCDRNFVNDYAVDWFSHIDKRIKHEWQMYVLVADVPDDIDYDTESKRISEGIMRGHFPRHRNPDDFAVKDGEIIVRWNGNRQDKGI